MSRRLSPAAIRKAQTEMDHETNQQQTLAEHITALKPTHTDTSTQGDWTKTSRSTCQPRIDICAARQAAWSRIAKANAAKQD